MRFEGTTLQIILGEQLGQSVHNTRFGENKRLVWYLGLERWRASTNDPRSVHRRAGLLAEG